MKSKRMLRNFVFTIFSIPFFILSAQGQEHVSNIDSIKQQVFSLQADVENIHLNLEKSKSKFQRGIFVATLGYTITIAGGLMLGRENDKLGQGMLVLGGATGITGTYMLVDAFKFLGRTRRNPGDKP